MKFLVLLALAFTAALMGALPALADNALSAKTGDLSMTLSVAGPQKIAAYEPVILKMSLKNTTNHQLDQAHSPDYTTRIEIRDSAGDLVASTPLLQIPANFLCGILCYAPGQTRTFYLAVSNIYSFEKPGTYRITVSEGMTREERDGLNVSGQATPFSSASCQLHMPSSPAFDIIAQASTSLRVLPYNQKALESRLRLLLEPLVQRKSWSNMIMNTMWSVRHDAVIPYLVQAAEFGADLPKYSARALLRIGTPRALQALKKLTDRQDSIGKMARDGLALSISVTAYDWFVE